MRITCEDVIRTIDLAMSERNALPENIEAAQQEIQKMAAAGAIDGTWYISSHRPVIGKLIILVKRFMRKMLHGYIPPIVEKINYLETSQNRALQYLIKATEEMSNQMVIANETQKANLKRIEELEKELATLIVKLQVKEKDI